MRRRWVFPEQLLAEELPAHLTGLRLCVTSAADQCTNHGLAAPPNHASNNSIKANISATFSAFPASGAFPFRPDRRGADADDGPVDLALISRVPLRAPIKSVPTTRGNRRHLPAPKCHIPGGQDRASADIVAVRPASLFCLSMEVLTSSPPCR